MRTTTPSHAAPGDRTPRFRGAPAAQASSSLGQSDTFRWTLVGSIAGLAFSYHLTTPILLAVGANTAAINFAIKAVLAITFSGVVVGALAIGRSIRGPALVLVAYLLLLGVRLLYDTLVRGIVPIFQTEFYVLSYYFGLTIIPVLAILLGLRSRDTKLLHDVTFWVLAAANLALFFYIIGGGVITSDTVFAGRFEVAGSQDQTAVLNPIGVGAAGAFLAAIAIGRLTVLRSLGTFGQAFAMAMIVLGVTNMFAGGSRGPALALGLVLLATLYTLIRGLSGRGMIRPRLLMWAYSAMIAAGFAVFIMSQTVSVQVFNRFSTMFESRMQGGREERDYALANALADFADSPYYGSSYLTTIGQQFPHNIAVDALMATGIFGFGLFAIALLWALRGLVRMLHGHAGPHGFGLSLTAICVFTLGMTSGAAWQSPDFWVIVTSVFVLGNAPAVTSQYRQPVLAQRRASGPARGRA